MFRQSTRRNLHPCLMASTSQRAGISLRATASCKRAPTRVHDLSCFTTLRTAPVDLKQQQRCQRHDKLSSRRQLRLPTGMNLWRRRPTNMVRAQQLGLAGTAAPRYKYDRIGAQAPNNFYRAPYPLKQPWQTLSLHYLLLYLGVLLSLQRVLSSRE